MEYEILIIYIASMKKRKADNNVKKSVEESGLEVLNKLTDLEIIDLFDPSMYSFH